MGPEKIKHGAGWRDSRYREHRQEEETVAEGVHTALGVGAARHDDMDRDDGDGDQDRGDIAGDDQPDLRGRLHGAPTNGPVASAAGLAPLMTSHSMIASSPKKAG